MAAERDGPSQPGRLQIRLSVDVHMQDLHGWLLAMPATVRGRELLAQVRVARALAGLMANGSRPPWLPVDPTVQHHQPMPGAPEAEGGCLSSEAVEQASARLGIAFLAAVPPAP